MWVVSGLLTAALAAASARAHQCEVAAIEITRIDELEPVPIGHDVPTGELDVSRAAHLNLPVWARMAMRASTYAIGELAGNTDPSKHVSSLQASLQRQVGFDLHVQACAFKGEVVKTCKIELQPAEDQNRYIHGLVPEVPMLERLRKPALPRSGRCVARH